MTVHKPIICVLSQLFLILFALSEIAIADNNSLVSDIVKAPIVPDGDVAGAPTDFVIDFDKSLDPTVNGRSLLTGGYIKVTLPAGFTDTGSVPLMDVGSAPNCEPGNLVCNTAVLLQGWPQNPVPPPRYTLSLLGNSLIYTAVMDTIPAGPGAPGVKQAHLILKGFRNPGPGHYWVTVEYQQDPGAEVETGRARIQIVPKIRPSINVTSVFAEGPGMGAPPNPDTIYQTTLINEMTPWPWDFLLWDRKGNPLSGVTLAQTNENHYLMMQSGKVVGQVFIDAPAGATGHTIALPLDASFEIPSAPIIPPPLIPVARLNAWFTAGSMPGRYVTTFQVNNGNSVQMVVDATELADAAASAATCADIHFDGEVWGLPAIGVDLRAYTNSELHFVGCPGNGCNPSTFYCTHDAINETLEFGTTSSTSVLRALVDPGNVLGDTNPTSFSGCCDALEPSGLCNAFDSNGNGTGINSIEALCDALGYQSGTFVRQIFNNSCPEVHATATNGLVWNSDYVNGFGGGQAYQCAGFK